MLDIPGYDVAALVEKSGKSASHVNLIARLPQESQAEAFEQCWRKDWQDTEPHLLPAKHLAAWIQANLYLSLADAPFDREDPTLNPAAGACVTCPRRNGFKSSLFSDVTDGDQCLSGPCYQIKLTHTSTVRLQADGYAEREATLLMLEDKQQGRKPLYSFEINDPRNQLAAVANSDSATSEILKFVLWVVLGLILVLVKRLLKCIFPLSIPAANDGRLTFT